MDLRYVLAEWAGTPFPGKSHPMGDDGRHGIKIGIIEEQTTVDVWNAPTLPFNDPVNENDTRALQPPPESPQNSVPFIRRWRAIPNGPRECKARQVLQPRIVDRAKEVVITPDCMSGPAADLRALRRKVFMGTAASGTQLAAVGLHS